MDEFTYIIVATNAQGESLGALTNPYMGAWAFDSQEEAEEFLRVELLNDGVPPVPEGGAISVMTLAEYNALPWVS